MDADDRMSADPGHAALDALLRACVEREASDLHLSAGLAPTLRIHGGLVQDDAFGVLSAEAVAAIVDVLLGWSGRAGLDATGSQDGAFTAVGDTRFRFNAYRTLRGFAVAIRRLEERFWSLGELGLPESLDNLCDLQDGLVVVAGPTGSGKSTTLASLIDRINRTRPCHVVTIEDPIEYVHLPRRALVHQRQIGAHASGFHEALVAALREDPDVILLGEVRDLDTIRTVIRAAETGHLVFTTVHAGDCVGALERLVSVFPAAEQAGIRTQLSLVLRAVVAQRLLPAARVGDDVVAVDRARVVASEVLRTTPAIAHLIASGRSAQIYAAMETGTRLGMQTIEHDLARLVGSGRITDATAIGHARSAELLNERTLQQTRRPLERGAS